MAVLSFASLKGGVGKTSLSVHIARALAERGCETLLVDLDPTAHASKFFKNTAVNTSIEKSALARVFFSHIDENSLDEDEGILERALGIDLPLVHHVSESLSVLPASAEYRHFLWGRGARLFKTFFPKLIYELNCVYDCIVIDTPPDYNVLTRNAIGSSDVVVVPVDSSEMSINSLEEMLACAGHIEGPQWAVIRVMLNRQATRINRLSENRLSSNLKFQDCTEPDEGSIESFDSPDAFIAMLDEHEKEQGVNEAAATDEDDSPIYLLRNAIYRTELHNRLTYLGKTAFDTYATRDLATQYSQAASELERLLSMISQEETADYEESAPEIGGCESRV